MHSPLQDKLIHGESGDIEAALRLAIRRAGAAGDETALMKLADSVGVLSQTAMRTRDSQLLASVRELLGELRAAASGGKVAYRPAMEYKDCAMPLHRAGSGFQSKLKSGAMK